MNADEKLKILHEAQKEGISRTCNKYGISRTLYYRWLSRYKNQGIQGLSKLKGNIHPINKTTQHMESKINELVLRYPDYGPKAIMYLLDEMGYQIGESAVYNVMKRHDLNTKQKRMGFIASKKTKKKIKTDAHTFFGSGECWNLWITDYGDVQGVGRLYEYVICDFESRIACARLGNQCKLENVLDLLSAVAVPVAQLMNLSIKRVNVIATCTFKDISKIEIINGIQGVFRNWGMECEVCIMKSDDVSVEVNQVKQDFSNASMSYLLPMIQNGLSLKALKLEFQRWIRTYNISAKQTYSLGEMSPIEYHMACTKEKMILPLWAYLDREY